MIRGSVERNAGNVRETAMPHRRDLLKARLRSTLLAVALGVFLTAAPSEAQTRWWSGFTYQVSMGQQDTELFSDNPSWRNFGLDFRALVQPRVSVGLYTGWHTFDRRVDGTLSLGGVDVSGLQRRYANVFPLLATGHYYLGSGRTRPFLGLGVGTYWIENKVEVGLSSITDSNWHLGLAPELGVILPIGRGPSTYLSVRYNHAFESGDFQHAFWTFGVGIGTGF